LPKELPNVVEAPVITEKQTLVEKATVSSMSRSAMSNLIASAIMHQKGKSG
jgi:hypothetical protein